MFRINRSTRSRVTALAVAMALSLSLVAAPAAVAQDDSPQAAVEGLLADIEAANFDVIVDWFCDEFKDQASSLDMSSLSESLPPDVDPASVLGAFNFNVQVESIETVSQSETEAIVKLVATLAMDIDVDALEPLIVAVLEAEGQEATPDMVALVGSMMASQLAGESIDISEEITVVPREDGSWGLICSELGGDDEEEPDAGSSGDPATEEEVSS